MQEIDVLLDAQPTLALEMVECDITNKQAHNELQAYNDHKIFLYKHPFTRTRKYHSEQFTELYELKRKHPELFLQEIANLAHNIRRIESNIRKKKYKTPDELKGWEENLSKAKTKNTILMELISK
jgi:virulence-associated protein VapD